MRRRLGCFTIVIMLLGGPGQAMAQTGPYLQMALGMTVAPPLTLHGSDNDWGTKCDLIINPNGVEVTTECDAEPPPSSWTNAISGGRGLQSDLAVGYDWGAVRFEVEYFYRVTAYNDRVDANIFDEVTLDKQEQELERADGGADDLQSHNVFANVYYDLTPTSSPWNPYIGGGVGAEWASLLVLLTLETE